MCQEVLKVIKPFLLFFKSVDSNNVPTMLIIMLHPHFKFLQVGCGDAIYFSFDYDVRMVIIFFMFSFDQINIILACATHNNKLTIGIEEDNFNNMFNVGASMLSRHG
jgi:hypothetical protein